MKHRREEQLPPNVLEVQAALADRGPLDLPALAKELHERRIPIQEARLEALVLRYEHLFSIDHLGRVTIAAGDGSDIVDDEEQDLPAEWWTTPPEQQPLDRQRVVALDIETTGLDAAHDQLLEIALVTLDGQTLWAAMPMGDADAQRRALHELAGHLEGIDGLVGHRLHRFDLPFLEKLADRLSIRLELAAVPLDVHELSLLVDPTLEGRSLGALCEHFGVPHEAPHTAVGDAKATAALAQELLAHVDPAQPSWQLSWRVLSQGAHPWTRLLALPAPASVEGALTPVADPLVSAVGSPEARGPVRGFVRDAFERHGKRMDDYKPRPAQLEMASAVGDVLGGEGHLLVEAPTGTGKSLAYLVPAAWRARTRATPVVVATHTKVLQRQLRRDAERLRASGVLDAPFRQIQGVANYICPRNIAEAIRESDASTGWFAVAVAIRALATAPNGLWDDVTDTLLARTDLRYRRHRAALRVTAATCERKDCALVDRCPLYQRLAGIDEHPGIIAGNHALLAIWARQAAEGTLPGGLFGTRPTAIVVDEAHNLEDSLTSAWADRTSAIELAVLRAAVWGRSGLVRRLRRDGSHAGVPTEAVAELAALERELRTAEETLGRAIADYLHDFGGASGSVELRPSVVRRRQLFSAVAQAVGRSVALLRVLIARLIAVRPTAEGRTAAALNRRVTGVIDDVSAAAEALTLLRDLPDDHAFLHRLSVPSDVDAEEAAMAWEFERLPIDVAPLYVRYVGSASRSVVLTSATLRVAGRFDFIGARLGLSVQVDDEHEGSSEPSAIACTALSVDSPFRYDEQSAVVLTSHLPLPVPAAEAEFCEELGADQVGFLSLTGGRELGLFAARRRMEHVASIVREHEAALRDRGVEVLVQGDDSPARIQSRFRADPGTVVFGVRSYWEGFDAPGETLSYLMIEKPPYPHPDDELARARQRMIEDRGGDSFLDYVVPLTAIAMTQGFGRLIRTETDRGVALIADRRMQQPSAANGILLGSLPTSNLHFSRDREDAWRFAIEFVTGQEPDLTQALLVSTDRIGALLAELCLLPGEDPEPKLRRAALEIFGIEDLRPEQLALMRAVLEGRDALGILPTGFGKSICFQLPALLHPEGLPTIVVSPLVALIKDQVDELRGRRGIRLVAGITGRTSAAERTETMRDLAAGTIRLLYVSPERLVRDPTLRESIARQQLGAVVVDEAHCLSSWGHDFRPEFREIDAALATFKRSPRLGLTATATREVEADIRETLELENETVVRLPMDRADLSYWVHKANRDSDRTRELLRFVLHVGATPGIVYASRRALTEELAWILRQAGISARSYHAGMVPEQRDAIQEDFLAGTTQVIVATKAFGMGVNKPDIGWVVHYDLPESLESYAQEAGRAARSPELRGTCLLMYTAHDIARRQGQIARDETDRHLHRARALLNLLPTLPTRGPDVLLDPEEVADRLGIDAEELNVLVAWLDRTGAVSRLHDASVRARVSVGWQEPDDPDERLRFVRIVKQTLRCRIGADRRIDLEADAAACDMDPDELERTLIDWSLRRLVTFQSTQRRWRIRPNGPLREDRFRDVIRRWQTMERRRLDEMIRYAQGRSCRRAAILRAFGDEVAECAPGQEPCDVHAGSAPPWHQVPIADVPDPEELVNVDLVLLQAIRWASRLAKGSYGEVGLKAALCGKESLGEGRPLGPGLLSCPQFGALRYLQHPEKRLETSLNRLLADGLVERRETTNGDRRYHTLVLTDAGRAQLEVVQ